MSEHHFKAGKAEQLKSAEAALTKHGFTTNDIIMIPGRLRVSVNGIRLKLGDHAFSLLLLLAERTLTAPGDYVATAAAIRAIESNQGRLGALEMSWMHPTGESVHRAVCELRAALKKEKLNQALVELVRGEGYRLNTPAENIWIAPSLGIARPGQNPGMRVDYWHRQKDFRGKFGFMGKSLE